MLMCLEGTMHSRYWYHPSFQLSCTVATVHVVYITYIFTCFIIFFLYFNFRRAMCPATVFLAWNFSFVRRSVQVHHLNVLERMACR